MTVRVATPADAPQIARIQVEAWRAAYVGIISDSHLAGLSIEARTDFWSKNLSSPANNTLVAETPEGRVAGWLTLSACRDADGEGVGEIYALYVDPECWGTGTGKRLMAEALRLGAQRGYRVVTLWVLADNQRARRFYASVGFVQDGMTKNVMIGERDLLHLRLRRPLVQEERVGASCAAQRGQAQVGGAISSGN